MDNPELLAFSEQTRRAASRIMSALIAGNTDGAFEIAGELCTDAAGIKARLQMQDESTGDDRYDLAALVVNTTTPTDSETPFEDE